MGRSAAAAALGWAVQGPLAGLVLLLLLQQAPGELLGGCWTLAAPALQHAPACSSRFCSGVHERAAEIKS